MVWHSSWLVFDMVLAASMIWETWIQVALVILFDWEPIGPGGATNSLRILRLFRVARMARLMRMLPELCVLVKGMAAGMRAIAAVMVMGFLILYVFAIVFVQLGTFANVPAGIQFLLSQVLCGFDSDFFQKQLEAGWTNYIAFLMFMLLASFTLLNMLIGILCQVISDVTNEAQEEQTMYDLDMQVDCITAALDDNNDGRFSLSELEQMITSPEDFLALAKLGVDYVALVNHLRLFLADGTDDISWDDFKTLIMQCVGSRSLTVKDLMEHRHYMSLELSRIESRVNRLAYGSP